ncbi:MAG TPA: hypothetical protein VGK46_07630 [Saprospiraceae bacterium]
MTLLRLTWQLQSARIDFALDHVLIYGFEANASNVNWIFKIQLKREGD